jgi:hypothetical protein
MFTDRNKIIRETSQQTSHCRQLEDGNSREFALILAMQSYIVAFLCFKYEILEQNSSLIPVKLVM